MEFRSVVHYFFNEWRNSDQLLIKKAMDDGYGLDYLSKT